MTLFERVTAGDVEGVHQLLSSGSDPNEVQDGDHLLLIANVEIAQLLIDHGTNVNCFRVECTHPGGQEFLRTHILEDLITFGSHPGVAELLVKHGSNPNTIADNECRESVLMMAACDLDYGLVKTLISHGADVTHRNSFGHTAIDYAVRGVCSRFCRSPISALDTSPDGESERRGENFVNIILALTESGCELTVEHILSAMSCPTLGEPHQSFGCVLDLLELMHKRPIITPHECQLFVLKFLTMASDSNSNKDEGSPYQSRTCSLFYRAYSLIFWRYRLYTITFFKGVANSVCKDDIPLAVREHIIRFMIEDQSPSLFSILLRLVV